MSTNPFAQLKQKLVACLKIEAKLEAAEREANQMSFLVKIGNTQAVLVKGGVNTIGLTLGNGKRKIMFPDEALETLDKLAKRPHWYYEVGSATVFSLGTVLKREPTGPQKIIGVGPKGRAVLYVAKPTLSGSFEWHESKKA